MSTERTIIITDVLGRTFALDLKESDMLFQETDHETIKRVNRAINSGDALVTEHGIICFSPRHVVSIHWGV